MGNSRRRTVYSVGEAIRLQRETLRFCSAMFNEPYLDAGMRQSLRTEIARVLNLTVAVESHMVVEMGSTPVVPLCVKKRLPHDPDAICYCHDCFPDLGAPSPDGRRMAETENTGSGRKPDQQVPGSNNPPPSSTLDMD